MGAVSSTSGLVVLIATTVLFAAAAIGIAFGREPGIRRRMARRARTGDDPRAVDDEVLLPLPADRAVHLVTAAGEALHMELRADEAQGVISGRHGPTLRSGGQALRVTVAATPDGGCRVAMRTWPTSERAGTDRGAGRRLLDGLARELDARVRDDRRGDSGRDEPRVPIGRRRLLVVGGVGIGLAALGGAAWEVDRVASEEARRATRSRPAGRARPATPDKVRVVILDSGVLVPSADWVVDENQRPGTLDWVMGADTRIYGYADRVSAVLGDEVTLFVDPPAVPYRVELYRMGYYGGLGGRLVWRSGWMAPAAAQPAATVAPGTNMVECQWRPTTRIGIDHAWPPGAYLIKLTGDDGGLHAGYIPLCVRDDDSTAAYAVMHSVTTWQAYNAYGGRSLYVGPGSSGGGESGGANRSRVVSFDRPYDQRGWGAPDFMGNEYPVVFLAERLGLDVTYITDIDLHQQPDRLLRHRCLFSLGHDEYWSSAMRDGASRAVGQGVNLAFLGANAVYRHIRLEPSPLGADRHQVCYKTDFAHEDPLWGIDPAEVTANWPDGPDPRPEQQLVGSQYADVGANADLVVVDAAAWVFQGTGLVDGQHLPGVVQGEYDRYEPGLGGPDDVMILAHSPVANRGPGRFSDMTYYSAPGGGGVLATGSAAFVSRLADAPLIGANIVRPAVPGVTPVLERMMENVFAVFGTGPASVTDPSVANWRQFS